MITLEQTTKNIVYTKGLFAIPVNAFQFDWDILNRIFVSTFRKYERFCPLLKTLQTGGGNPIIMPEDCIYPRRVGFGNSQMIVPQNANVGSLNFSYDRQTRRLSVFTNTGSISSLQVQYLARYPQVDVDYKIDPYEVFDGETSVEIRLTEVPSPSTFKIIKGNSTLEIKSRTRESWTLEGTLGTAELDLSSLVLTIEQTDTSAGTIDISYTGQYKAFEYMDEDLDFFETWYAANILSSLGNIKAVLRVDEMPNNINADDLLSQGKSLYEDVKEWQQQKQFWFRGFSSAGI